MANLINIGLSGLAATQTALATTSNNITNVSTAGYSRQSTISNAGALQSIGGAGYVGTGTTLAEVRRIYSSYLQNQVSSSTALDSQASTYSDQVASLDSLLSDSTTGVTTVLSDFFSALQTSAASPDDTSARQLLVTSAQTLSSRFNSIYSQMDQQNSDINSELSSLSDQVNTLSQSIASLNQQIVALSANGTSPNSLLDARDQAVVELNGLVGVTVQERDGNYDVYLGSGQALVTGNNANTLSAQPSGTDPTQYSLTVNYANYSTDVTSVVTGGQIGGLLSYRTDVLQPAENELGRMAMVVSDSINSQLGQGLDANGDFGSNLFSSINSDSAIASRSLASSRNSDGSGNLDVTIDDANALTTYNYTVKFTDADTYTVTRSDGTVLGSAKLSDDPATSFDGFSLSLDGNAVAAGDSFTITPTRNGAQAISTTLTDVDKLAFAGALTGTLGSSNSGTLSISSQATLTSELDIYSGSDLATSQEGIENAMPVKLVFGSASSGSQGYTVYGAQGNSIGTGTIVPGQENTLSISVPMLDSDGAALYDADGNAMNATFEMSVSGSPQANDTLSVAFNSDGATDNRNASSLLTLQTAKTVGSSSGNGISLTDAYAKLVEGVGATAAQASSDATATATVLDSATTSRDSVAGVNLDEEAADLVKFQQYYTASSQIIKTAQEVFSALLNAL
ncbi:flagellar hook-associated protein FlgK [Pseudomonas typographi]|uniref:Flagellar hook-associated protein 1 n=1 Tax=Pseudomonas typographi TaxID=2715964 RepID=A0ABR7YZI9_9PSED|nr:flagellar hook-associated protein FlgK [Pseudomonas typographi]MBD1598646.1 flagellar hook-associated protein FlgK [Pseudomonas typographi]